MWRRLAWGISIHGSPMLLKKQVYWVLISARPAIGCVPGHGQDSGSRLWRIGGPLILCPGSAQHWHTEGLGNANEGPSEANSHRCVTSAGLLSPLNLSSALKSAHDPQSVMSGTGSQLQLSFPGRQTSQWLSCKRDRGVYGTVTHWRCH